MELRQRPLSLPIKLGAGPDISSNEYSYFLVTFAICQVWSAHQLMCSSFGTSGMFVGNPIHCNNSRGATAPTAAFGQLEGVSVCKLRASAWHAFSPPPFFHPRPAGRAKVFGATLPMGTADEHPRTFCNGVIAREDTVCECQC